MIFFSIFLSIFPFSLTWYCFNFIYLFSPSFQWSPYIFFHSLLLTWCFLCTTLFFFLLLDVRSLLFNSHSLMIFGHIAALFISFSLCSLSLMIFVHIAVLFLSLSLYSQHFILCIPVSFSFSRTVHLCPNCPSVSQLSVCPSVRPCVRTAVSFVIRGSIEQLSNRPFQNPIINDIIGEGKKAYARPDWL